MNPAYGNGIFSESDSIYRDIEMSGQTIQYRAMTATDIPDVHALSVQVKWPHRPEDWAFVFGLGGGVLACDGDQTVGVAMSWNFGSSHASLGMVIVSPDFQGRGIGKALMQLLLEQLSGRTVTLIATPAGEPLYRALGFCPTGVSVYQHQGAVFDVPMVPLGSCERVRPIGASDVEALAALSQRANGLPRTAMFRDLMEVAEGVALVRDAEICGFAFYRRFGRGFVIGPVVAQNQRQAQVLISHWLSCNIGIFNRIDVLSTSGLSEWLIGMGLAQVDTVTAMQWGGVVDGDGTAQCFAIANQALG
jgi:predicted N-acetyltransferase YhbS